MTIGERIKQRRLEMNMSQEELAFKCGYKSRSSINKIELARDLPLRKVELVAEALEVDPGYIMGWDINETDSSDGAILALLSHYNRDMLLIFNKLGKLPQKERETVVNLINSLYEKVETK